MNMYLFCIPEGRYLIEYPRHTYGVNSGGHASIGVVY